MQYHPDKNPNDMKAEEKTKSLIQAYEYLLKEDPRLAFGEPENEEFQWIDRNNTLLCP